MFVCVIWLTILMLSISSLPVESITPIQEQIRGYSGVIVMIMDGKYDMKSENPYIPDCVQDTVTCNGVYFWKIVLHEDPAEYFRRSKQYMFEKWGIDVSSMLQNGLIHMRDTYTDPRANYRAYAIPGETVHPLGWHVHNQAFQFTLRLGTKVFGAYGRGQHVPAGTSFVFGQYVIQKSTLNENGRVQNSYEHYRISYQSRHPVEPERRTTRVAFCEVTESPWGTGLITATSFLASTTNNNLSSQNWFMRTIITLDGNTGLGNANGVM